MANKPSQHLVTALAIHERKYFSMTPRREGENNALMFLGRADNQADAPSVGLEDWHRSALALLERHAPSQNQHEVEPGTTGAPGGGLLGSPWYAVFEFGHGAAGEAGDLWVGRFFAASGGMGDTSKTGVFVFPDALLPVEADGNNPILNSRRADRSVILAGQSAAGDNTLGSNHGGETEVRNEW